LALAALTAAIITVNWGIYVWAIGQGRALETALGYYINPLLSILLGAVFLGEKLTRAQMVAIGLAACAVVILTVHAGGLPWVSLALTVSWGAYALCKRTIPIGAAQGFFLEVLLLLIPALGYIGWLAASGQGHFAAMEMSDTGLLLFAGVVTAAPLITYATGAKLLRLSTIGIMQYIAPTMIFLTAVFVFGEPFDMTRGIAFCFIWAALIVYSWSLFAERRREAAKPPAA
jgi:chloramphenicol-sensitive protein RarD